MTIATLDALLLEASELGSQDKRAGKPLARKGRLFARMTRTRFTGELEPWMLDSVVSQYRAAWESGMRQCSRAETGASDIGARLERERSFRAIIAKGWYSS